MSEEKYYELYYDVDLHTIREMTKEELQKQIDESIEYEEEVNYDSKVPEDAESGYKLIIKGKIIVPKPTQVVKKYEIE